MVFNFFVRQPVLLWAPIPIGMPELDIQWQTIIREQCLINVQLDNHLYFFASDIYQCLRGTWAQSQHLLTKSLEFLNTFFYHTLTPIEYLE